MPLNSNTTNSTTPPVKQLKLFAPIQCSSRTKFFILTNSKKSSCKSCGN